MFRIPLPNLPTTQVFEARFNINYNTIRRTSSHALIWQLLQYIPKMFVSGANQDTLCQIYL